MVLISWPAARSALMRARSAVERARGMVAVVAVDGEGVVCETLWWWAGEDSSLGG